MQSAKKMTRNGPKIVTLKYGSNFIASDVRWCAPDEYKVLTKYIWRISNEYITKFNQCTTTQIDSEHCLRIFKVGYDVTNGCFIPRYFSFQKSVPKFLVLYSNYCIVASRNKCYYSGNQKFCILKSRLLTCRTFL